MRSVKDRAKPGSSEKKKQRTALRIVRSCAVATGTYCIAFYSCGRAETVERIFWRAQVIRALIIPNESTVSVRTYGRYMYYVCIIPYINFSSFHFYDRLIQDIVDQTSVRGIGS
jgi:hypothetical protein